MRNYLHVAREGEQEEEKKKSKTRVPSMLLGDVPAQLSASSAVLTVNH